MREILFRGKRKDTGYWVYGNFVDIRRITTHKEYDDVLSIEVITKIVNRHFSEDVDPETVGEFTGLEDKDCKPIFEGDIVKIDNGADEETIIGFVVYEYASWQIDCGPDFISLWRHLDELKEYQSVGIIGNIHDAPELLELKKKE
jgi:uncharacterized phage protein (TIGR01671 family)